MEITKRTPVSDCCESDVHFIPPSLGDPGFYFCTRCNKECKTKIITVQTHEKISDGIYRPIEPRRID